MTHAANDSVSTPVALCLPTNELCVHIAGLFLHLASKSYHQRAEIYRFLLFIKKKKKKKNMPPTIHFVRHAQGAHNGSAANEFLIDPGLTKAGEEQCQELRAKFPHHDELSHVVVSPMRRAIQTGLLSFARPELGPVIASDLVQETSDAPNDIGSDLGKLRDAVGNAVDLSRVGEAWNDKSTGQFFEPTWEKLLYRTKEARKMLRELCGHGDGHVVVIAHGGVLHYLTEDWQGISLTHRK